MRILKATALAVVASSIFIAFFYLQGPSAAAYPTRPYGVGTGSNNTWTGTQTFSTPASFAVGSVGSPSITFTGHTTDGIWWNNGISVTFGGTQYFLVSGDNSGTIYTPGTIAGLTGNINIQTPTQFSAGLACGYTAQSGTTFTVNLDGNGKPARCVVRMTNAAARTVTLPTASSYTAGALVIVQDGNNNAGTNNISVARSGSDTINGGTGNVAVVTANSAKSMCIGDGSSAWVCGINN